MRSTPKLLFEILTLLTLSTVMALTVNYFSPRGIALFGDWDATTGVITAKPKQDIVDHDREIQKVSHVKNIHAKGLTLFVDARSQEDYKEGHIPGAVSYPVGMFDDMFLTFVEKYPPETPIIVYCSGRTCSDSHKIAQVLTDAGYSHVRVFIDGFPGWQQAGFPVETENSPEKN